MPFSNRLVPIKKILCRFSAPRHRVGTSRAARYCLTGRHKSPGGLRGLTPVPHQPAVGPRLPVLLSRRTVPSGRFSSPEIGCRPARPRLTSLSIRWRGRAFVSMRHRDTLREPRSVPKRGCVSHLHVTVARARAVESSPRRRPLGGPLLLVRPSHPHHNPAGAIAL
jgi:hypothetical protein